MENKEVHSILGKQYSMALKTEIVPRQKQK